MELLDEILERLEGAQDQLAEIATTSKHDATRVGAIRTSLDALRDQTEILMAVGVLPRSLGRFRYEADVELVTRTILDVFERYRVPLKARREIEAAVRLNGHPN